MRVSPAPASPPAWGAFTRGRPGRRCAPAAVCVPCDYDRTSGLEFPHSIWDGLQTRLKAVVYTDTPTDQLTCTWDFGDGSDPITGAISNKRVVETTHLYEGTPGTLYTATLTVHDPVHGNLVDSYPVRIHERDLSVEVNAAIDEGLWWLHKNQNSDGSWPSYSSYRAGSTASAVHAMEINGHVPTRPISLDPLVDDVQRGLRKMFKRSVTGLSRPVRTTRRRSHV